MRLLQIECVNEFKTRTEALRAAETALQASTPVGHTCHVTGLIANEQPDGTWTVTMRAQSFPEDGQVAAMLAAAERTFEDEQNASLADQHVAERGV